MSLPEIRHYRNSYLVVIGGLLSLFNEEWPNNHSIWTMKEYNVQSSWTRTLIVSYPHGFTRSCFNIICSIKSGDFVGSDERSTLAKFNDKGERQELRSYNINDPFYDSVVVYQESLLSLPCDNEQVGKDD